MRRRELRGAPALVHLLLHRGDVPRSHRTAAPRRAPGGAAVTDLRDDDLACGRAGPAHAVVVRGAPFDALTREAGR